MKPQLSLALLVALPLVACTTDSSPSEEATAADLEKESGGYTTADEAAAFDAEELYASASIEADTAVVDELAGDPSIVEMSGSVTAEAHDFALLWGRMPADPDATGGRDWSGRIQLSRGAMVVRRRIAFEQSTDRVLPRTQRDLIEFKSVTRPFADGLVLRVFDPTPADPNPLTLTYTSDDGTQTYALELRRLAQGPIVVDAGDGNRVIATGRRRADFCNHGTMRGRWHALAPNFGGYLGIVSNAAGEPVGHVRGIYGQRRGGEQVVFGKFIDRDGQFSGLISGQYTDGRFEARWIDRGGDHGVLHGAFFEGASLRAGVFAARWQETSCDAR
ncbi:MAG: hypothetical protein ABI867_31165, partial [Kofleriaceae bacterium]